MPTVETTEDDKKGGRLSSFRNSSPVDKTALEQNALTSTTDPDWEAPSMELLEKKQKPAGLPDTDQRVLTWWALIRALVFRD